MSSLITDIGNQKLLVASPQTPVTIKSVAVGSGRGAFDSSILALQDKKWIGSASAPIKNGKTLEFDCQIPLGIGGFEVAEWGLIDVEGDLIAYGQIPETVNKITSMTLTPTFVMELGDSISSEIIVTDEINFRHNGMTERDAVDAHPMSSITGLTQAFTDVNTSITNTKTELSTSINLGRKYKKISANYTVLNDDGGVIEVDASAGDLTITMPLSSAHIDKKISFVRTDTSASTVTIIATGSDKLIGEGFIWPLAKINQNELFIFKAGTGLWTGIRGASTGVSKDNLSGNYFLIYRGNAISRLILESDVRNNITSTDEGNPLSAAMGKFIYDRMFGVGQTVQNLTANRAFNTVYTNSTSKPIAVMITYTDIGSVAALQVKVNNVLAFSLVDLSDLADNKTTTFIVPSGQSYTVETTNTLIHWSEMR